MISKFKILVLVGPTSSGKSELAVRLAKRFGGEIISCDSRQIYKSMDLGTGKVKGQWTAIHPERSEGSFRCFAYKNIPHHLIDFVNPKEQYSAALFQQQAQKIISEIFKRGNLPILCGGTGHWVDAAVYNQSIPEVKPNLKLRKELGKKSAADLFSRLKKLDPIRAKTIDRLNKRRLIRALEIIILTGKPVPEIKQENDNNSLWLGINLSQKTLYKNIEQRLKQRLKAGLVKEVARLHKQGLSWKRLMDFGLEYKYVSLYLQKKLTYDEMFEQLSFAIKHYAKRQITWWKRNKKIIWIKDLDLAENKIKRFLK